MEPVTLSVVGIGRIGCVTAACLAQAGHAVRGIDINESRLAAIRSGKLPFHEPQLLEILREALSLGNLTATSNLREGVARADVVMLCIGTESLDGTAVVAPLLEVVDQLVQAYHEKFFNGIIVIRSTVPPGTCRSAVLPRLAGTDLRLVFQPEFLREGNSVRDFKDPSLLVVGSTDSSAAQRVAGLYGSAAAMVQYLSLEEAELVKYACNAFHGLKIAFANEIGALSEGFGARGAEVMRVLASDSKLNASGAYLRPGFAFGGYCLPKDAQVLESCAVDLGLELPLISGILSSNKAQLDRAVTSALNVCADVIGVFGISFKAGTDDLRASPALHLAEALLREGKNVHLFDPCFSGTPASGESPMLTGVLSRATLHADLSSWIRAVDGVILTQVPDADSLKLLRDSRLPIADCFGVASPAAAPPESLPPQRNMPEPIAPRGPLIIEDSLKPGPTLSVVVPTYQEAQSIQQFLYGLCASLDRILPIDYEVIVVDDDSPDRTWQVAAAIDLPQVRIMRRQGERGLATAVIRGWQVARGQVLGTINADFQHPPALIASLWEALQAAGSQEGINQTTVPSGVAIATRYAHGGGVGDWSLLRRLFSKSATLMARCVLPANVSGVSDPMSGCYLFHRSIIAGIELKPAGYKTLVEILVRGKQPLQLVEVPYQMAVRTTGESKANVWRSFDFVVQLVRLRWGVRDYGARPDA